MALVTDLSTLFDIVHLVGYTGQFSGTQGTTDLSSSVGGGISGIAFSTVGDLDTTNNVTFGFNIYYKIQGWNPETQTYEIWHSMGTPLLTSPRGTVLEDVSVVGTWTDR